jgi:protease-4
MTRKYRGAVALFLSVVWLASGGSVFAQRAAASAATAEGYEGLQYNPAAVATGRSLAAAFAATYADQDEYGLSAVLSDSLRLDYLREPAGEKLNLLYGLAFPRQSAFHVGVRAEADLLGFQWDDVDLATGLLWYPHRYVALAAVQERLQEPQLRRYTFGLGLRPFTDRLTLFGDLLFPHDFGEVDAAVGLRGEPVQGVRAGLRVENHFRDFVASLSIASGPFAGDLSLSGDFDFEDLSFGAGVRYNLAPSRSVIELAPRVYHLDFTRPIDAGSTRRDSLYNLDSLITRLHQLAGQERTETLVLTFRGTTVSSPYVLEELVEAFSYLKSRGKRIVTYLDSSYSEFDYLAAAAGTTVVAAPYALVPLVGVSSRQLFFKRLFEELGIEVEYARTSQYKSALDPLLREDLSEENRRQLEEYLGSSYELILDVLVSSRGFSRQRAVELVDGGPYWSGEALEKGLVDQVQYYRDFEERYLKEGAFGRLSYLDYQPGNWRAPQIAVLKAAGPIVNSRLLSPWQRLAGRGYISDGHMIPLLGRLQEDDRVAGVVLYIDSSGGDGMVSDKIWKAIMELKEEKPVVVVIGGAAASGGYYLAMTGERVFARRTALTGSIGSFSFKLVVAELLEKLGITSDAVRFGENAELFSPLTTLDEDQREKLKSLNDVFTDRFYAKVAESRSLSYETVEGLGGGKIYSGGRALELELIDEIGGVYSALSYLEGELKLSAGQYWLRYYPDRYMFFLWALQALREEGLSLHGRERDLIRLLRP